MARPGQLTFLGRVFATAIARRLPYALCALLLAWCGSTRAQSQFAGCYNVAAPSATCEDKGIAYSQVQRMLSNWMSANPPGDPAHSRRICITTQDTIYGRNISGYVTHATWTPACDGSAAYTRSRDWPDGATCEKRPDFNGPGPSGGSSPVSGSYQCNSGCVQTWTPNSDGTYNGSYLANQVCDPGNDNCGPGFHYNAFLALCEPDAPPECPKGQIKKANGQCTPNECPEGMTLQQDGTCGPSNNECPSGQIKSPAGGCLPGDGQCAKGEVRGPDGTCKKDGDGDGDPDEPGEGDKSQFSGGDDCSSPPSCSGDAIMCGQARIQWRIDCNTRKNRNVSGGTCNAPPVCTGEKCDAVEYASMMFQWRTACASEKLLAMGNGNGGTDGEQPAWTKVGGMSQDPGAGASAGDTTITTNKITGDDLDQSGFGGGQCIGFAAGGGGTGISSGFTQTMASPPAIWCNYITAVKGIFIVIGAVASVIILAKMGNS
ncbi:hypothetical protein NY99_22530 [Xanthomonas phaseoli pv. phaseoli]|nr:hypothetical protein NY99_22530 [Xanthomonas phaseoli pv. phaseoli]KKY07982.1 hypothetical protein RM60_22945 [Xanthomonas phaseoli pv. phaseoli]KKY07985.1 hypothetical protein RM60_22970 [Xanthomonas phaseoli pv. phaseoli]KKY08394.1 hypothetical protein QQ30_23780 [Xanthomonas phaseoli pv. phaseoli]